MEVNYEQLIKKILDFWKKYDGKDFSSERLRENFTNYEIATILYDNSFYDIYYNIVKIFYKKIYKLDGLFTEKEAVELCDIVQDPLCLFKYLNDDKLLSFVSEDDYCITSNIANYLSSDEARIKGFNMVKDTSLKAEFVCNFDSDELKLKYLRKISLNYRAKVISTFKDEKLIEKYITFFRTNKGEVIVNLSNDDKKIYYLKKFFRILTNEDKTNIIASLKSNERL